MVLVPYIIQFIYLSFFLPIKSQILSSNILVQRGKDSLLVSLGNTTYKMYTDIELVANRTWYSKRMISRAEAYESRYVGHTQIEIEDVMYKGDILQQDFRIDSKDNSDIRVKINYVYIDHDFLNSMDSFSFAYQIEEEFSVVHQLYNKKYIAQRAFGFSLNETGRDLLLYYGGLPKEVTQNKKKFTCKVNKNYPTWGCNLNKVSFSDNRYPSYDKKEQYVYFKKNELEIFAPEAYMNYVKETALKEYFNSGVCSYNEERQEMKIVCKCTEINSFPDIYFTFDNNQILILDHSMIFKRYYRNYCSFIIQKNYFDKDSDNKWIIGNDYLLQFAELFDYDNNEISFYGNHYIFNSESTITINVLKVNCFCLITMILFHLYVTIYSLNKQLQLN